MRTLIKQTEIMNKAQRKIIEKLERQIEETRATLDEILGEVYQIAVEEENKFDNMSEGFQATQQGQDIENAAQDLSNAIDEIETAISSLESAVAYLQNSAN